MQSAVRYITLLTAIFWSLSLSLSAHCIRPSSSLTVEQGIPFEIRNGLIVIEAKVEGKKGLFLLDCGAPTLILNQAVNNRDEIFVTTDKEISGESVVNVDIEIGSYGTSISECWKLDLQDFERRIGFSFDGLIGVDVFKSRDLLIDFAHMKVYVVEAGKKYPFDKWATKVVRIPFTYHNENLPVLQANLQGKKLNLAFDTGANQSVLSDELKHILKKKKARDVKFKHLKIKDVPFQALDLDMFTDQNDNTIDGIISFSTFQAEQIFINFGEQYIYFFYKEDVAIR